MQLEIIEENRGPYFGSYELWTWTATIGTRQLRYGRLLENPGVLPFAREDATWSINREAKKDE